ncbi:MAG: TraB/GumN family protein [Phenylobacterium sp.]
MLRLIVMLAAVMSASPAWAKPAVWVVRDADSEMVLFGSVHVLPEGLDWRPAGLTRALERAQDVWFELPPGPETEAESARLAAERGRLAPGRRLSDLIEPRLYARLMTAAARYGLAPPMLDQMEPWLADVALAGAVFRAAGAQAAEGVEKQLAEAAPQARLRAFETPAEQIGFFDGAAIADQIGSLEESVAEVETDPDAYRRLVDAWLSGDPAAIERQALEPLRKSAPGLYRTVVVRRNAAWVERLDARLKGAGATVVIVGAGHLVGPDSLPARLRALGYSVEGP